MGYPFAKTVLESMPQHVASKLKLASVRELKTPIEYSSNFESGTMNGSITKLDTPTTLSGVITSLNQFGCFTNIPSYAILPQSAKRINSEPYTMYLPFTSGQEGEVLGKPTQSKIR